MAIRAGDRVIQPSYGVGEVVDISGERVTISFDDGVVRKFVASMVHLTPSDSPRPERPKKSRAAKKPGTETKAKAKAKPAPKESAE